MRLEHPPMQFLPAKALKLLENVLELKLRKLHKIILKLVTARLSDHKGNIFNECMLLTHTYYYYYCYYYYYYYIIALVSDVQKHELRVFNTFNQLYLK